jgi:hypothetical protein
VAWESNAAGRDADGVPRQFVTTSRLLIIANEWKTLDANVSAIQDRGHLVEFIPTAKEVHCKAGEWFDEPVIYKWFTDHLHLIPNHSMRLYKRASELQKANLGPIRSFSLKMSGFWRLSNVAVAHGSRATY